MNSKKKSFPARGTPQPFPGRVGSARPFKPVVAQLKKNVSALSNTHPVAPPVYRPQPVPKVLQTKSSSNQTPRAAQAPISRAHFPAPVRANAIGVVQRAEDNYAKQDDVWWPKAYRLNGPYKDLEAWANWGTVNRFRGFTGHQIKILIAANKMRNGGQLKSDAPNDPYPILAETVGEDDSVECDHVINGKLRGGSNHWWNARLISRKLNNSMERQADANDK